MSTYQELHDKISSKNAVLGVIGLGYVGLPLAVEFAHVGVTVIGFDVDEKKVSQINRGESYIQDIKSDVLKPEVDAGRICATSDFSRLQEADVISICVPTPLRKTKDPDMSYIFKAVNSIKGELRKGQLVILESTTYPGTTDEMVLPMLEETGLKVGKDFFLSFSPERVDPGNAIYTTKNTPKVIGGITQECTTLTQIMYAHAIDNLVLVSSPISAEMVKLYENTFRAVNIAMANEMVLMCDKLGVDVWEVIDAAATKPFGFMPFYPGPGLGGHCIPIDPHYLSWKLKTLDYDARFISLAGDINSGMPQYVADKTVLALNSDGKATKGASVLILGVAYKPNINDLRESPALDIMSKLLSLGAKVQFQDDLNPNMRLDGVDHKSVAFDTATLASADVVLILANHSYMDIQTIVQHSTLIIDARNATKGIRANHIHKL
ncbi:MAG: nucleotide sugar dehydrogenase [bacterium]|nr:nucleotide sugar dehydrogenase [bacterium]